MTQARHEEAMRRCEALDRARWQRATDLAIRAGLDVGRNVWSNAMHARDDGRPWVGVDYSILRTALRVDESRREIYALRTRITLAWLAVRWPDAYGKGGAS